MKRAGSDRDQTGVVVIAQVTVEPFRFQAHPDVWVLVLFLVGAYVYMVKRVGPHAKVAAA